MSREVSLTFRGVRVERPRALIMGIVNRTPDSFYDQGATFDEHAAREAVRGLVDSGADIIDIGGVKAGAQGEPVDADEEIRRVVPMVEWTRELFPDVVISVDTWRHEVGRVVCEAGAHLLNDTWAGADPALVDIAAEFGTGLVCSHTGGLGPRTDPHRPQYDDVVSDVVDKVTSSAEDAAARGVSREGILIDPTHDFGKNTWHSLELVRHTDQLVATGWPVLMAISNKDFIGEALGTHGAAQRQEGTLATIAVAASEGASVFRVHDVQLARETLNTVARIRQGTTTPVREPRACWT